MSNRRKQFRCMATAALTASFLLLPPLMGGAGFGQQGPQHGKTTSPGDGPAMARGPRSLARRIEYGDWQKFCFKTPGTVMACRTTISGDFDTGQTAVRIDLIEREGGGKARLQIFLPVGMYLPAGVKLTVDQDKPYQIPYVWCMTNTCIAGAVADSELIRDMEKGAELTIEVVDSSVQSVSTTLLLNRFAAARGGSPARTYQQDIDE